jgi:hypothetical protein
MQKIHGPDFNPVQISREISKPPTPTQKKVGQN